MTNLDVFICLAAILIALELGRRIGLRQASNKMVERGASDICVANGDNQRAPLSNPKIITITRSIKPKSEPEWYKLKSRNG
jgi:hypothetical protein